MSCTQDNNYALIVDCIFFCTKHRDTCQLCEIHIYFFYDCMQAKFLVEFHALTIYYNGYARVTANRHTICYDPTILQVHCMGN